MPTTLLQKLQLKSGQRLGVRNAPQGYVVDLEQRLGGIAVAADMSGTVDAILLFVNDLAETLELVPESAGAVKQNGVFWIAYPKGTSGVKTDINRDRLWQAVEPMGWRPVRQIALDEIWSAVRFRPAEHAPS